MLLLLCYWDLMENLKQLSEHVLLEKTSILAKEERTISIAVLHHLREIERRRAFAKLGYTSLYEYAVRELHYSESSAMRRVHAARALAESPVLAEKIESGALSVTQIARVHSFVRKEEKATGQKWDADRKDELFTFAEGVSHHELEKALIKISPESAVKESVRPVAEELVEVKIYLSNQDMQDLNEMRGLLAHQLKSPASNSELIRKLVQISKRTVVQAKTGSENVNVAIQAEKGKPAAPETTYNVERIKNIRQPILRPNAPSQRSRESEEETSAETEKNEASNTTQNQNRSISAQTRRFVFKRSGLQCEHVDPKTKVSCKSKFKLEVDHILPFSLGGTNDVDNLRVLCQGHNLNRTRML